MPLQHADLHYDKLQDPISVLHYLPDEGKRNGFVVVRIGNLMIYLDSLSAVSELLDDIRDAPLETRPRARVSWWA